MRTQMKKAQAMRACRRATMIAGILGMMTLRHSASAATPPDLYLTETGVANGVITFTLSLNDPSSSPNGLVGYDTNIYIDNHYLTFDGATPYTQTTTGNNFFPLQALTQTAEPIPLTYRSALYPSTDNTVLRVSYDNFFQSLASQPQSITLGTFNLDIVGGNANPVVTTVGLGGTTMGADSAGFGGSDMDDSAGSNVLASVAGATVTLPANASSAPEPSQFAGLAMFVSGVGVSMIRRRK